MRRKVVQHRRVQRKDVNGEPGGAPVRLGL